MWRVRVHMCAFVCVCVRKLFHHKRLKSCRLKPFDLRDITLHDTSQARKDAHTFSLACRNSKVDLTEAEKSTVVIKG